MSICSITGKRAFFRHLRRLNLAYTLAIADELKHLPHETLALWGRHDVFQKPGYADKLVATLPKAQLEWVEAGHWITGERPREVTQAIGRVPAQ